MLEKLPTIENYNYVIVIAILTFILTMVTAKGELTNEVYSHWWKKYTNRGLKAIGLGVAIGMVLFLQDVNNDNISNIKDRALRNEQNARARIIEKRVKEGVKESVDVVMDGISSAFTKQGLQYDRINKNIVVLKDSVRNTKGVIIPPLLRVRNLEFKDSSAVTRRNTILYEIISDNAVSYNCALKFDVFGITTNVTPTSIDFNLRALYNNITIAKEQRLSGYISFIDNFHCNTYVLRLKGFYYSSDKKLIQIDELYLLRHNGEKFIFELPGDFHERVFRDYIKKNRF